MYFASLFFLNVRNIATSILMVHLKYIVVHYANLTSSSIKNPFLSYRLLEPVSLPHFLHDFEEKYLSGYILLTD